MTSPRPGPRRARLAPLLAALALAAPLAAAPVDPAVAAEEPTAQVTLTRADVTATSVTLTGMVADKDLRNIAEDTVGNLPGVVRVDNRITLDPALQEHSDAWIAWKIRYQLLVRASVSNRDTKVAVADGGMFTTHESP